MNTKNTRIYIDYKDMTEGQQAFVKELAEDSAGHPLTPEGIQFWLELQRDKEDQR